MGLVDLFKGRFVDPTYPGVHAGGNVVTTTLDAVVKWGRKSSIWPMPFGTACCAIEFMALSASHYDIARFGAEVLRFSPRQADLMFVAGTIPDKLAPVLKTIYDQMPEPKWVISMGVCASSGSFPTRIGTSVFASRWRASSPDWIFCCRRISPWSRFSGVGGQPAT